MRIASWRTEKTFQASKGLGGFFVYQSLVNSFFENENERS